VNNLENAVTLNELKWDTDYFGVASAKAILHRPLTLNEWDNLKTRFRDYQFISIVNQNSEPVNAQLIGKDTPAFLADVNIQFEKKVFGINEMPENVTIHQSLERNKQILEIANFQFSKFTEDSELAKRGGDYVYRYWLINAFGKQDKNFALCKNNKGDINGFLLFSYSGNKCVIELIAVSKNETRGGIGTSLIKAVEYVALKNGLNQITVGTQVRNINAINFYHKIAYKQIGVHQVYHLWIR
jgi:dTDP-4-amino-4,6-dideoxy-D-galactose acyltransferase